METKQAQKPKFLKTIKERVEEKLDYLEALLGTPAWPRNIMTKATKGQILISSSKSFLRKLEEADFEDCYVATHSEFDKLNIILETIFLDFDSKENIANAISDALSVASKVEKDYGVVPHVQFSGSKGAHVIIPVEPITFETPQEEKSFLSYFQSEFETSNLDKQILGDFSRLMRVPFTINTKAKDMPWKGYVKILQEWNGKRANLEKDLQTWKVKRAIEESNAAQKPIVISPKGHIRKPVLELVERAEKGIHLTNNQRVAIALEYIANGYDDKEIAKIFEKQEDYGTGEKTLYHIRKLREGFESGGYKPYTTANLLKILEEVDD